MKIRTVLFTLLFLGIVGCQPEQPTYIAPTPTPEQAVPEETQPKEQIGTLIPYPEIIQPKEDKPEIEWTAPHNYRTDKETWNTEGGRTVRLMGCIEWKKRDPEADC